MIVPVIRPVDMISEEGYLMNIFICEVKSGQLGLNVHIQNKLLYHTSAIILLQMLIWQLIAS